jgi:hypothetical protein
MAEARVRLVDVFRELDRESKVGRRDINLPARNRAAMFILAWQTFSDCQALKLLLLCQTVPGYCAGRVDRRPAGSLANSVGDVC